MKAGEHLKPLTWGNQKAKKYIVGYEVPKIKRLFKYKNSYLKYNSFKEGKKESYVYKVFPTIEEELRVSKLDVWGLRPFIKNCPSCGGKYIPTPQSKKTCIPCRYIG